MPEPASTSAGSVAGYKFVLLSLPVVASLIAFWLGLRFVPLRPGHEREDLINRVMACLVSSFVLGVSALVLLMHHMPGAFDAGMRLATLAGLPVAVGFFTITTCVLIVCAIPGPWLAAATYLWLERRRGKDIAELARDARADVANVVKGGPQ